MSEYIDIVQAEIPSDVRSLVDSISATSRLMLTIDASHAGVVNLNHRLYRPPQVQNGAFSMIDRPFLKHHNDFDDPIGVVTDSDYEDIATAEFRSAHPTYMQPEFWAGGVPWQDVFSMCPAGVGKLVTRAQVTDRDAQEKILDRRFLRVSIKFRTDRMDCGCGKPKLDYWYEPEDDEEDDRFCSEIPGSRDKDGVLHFNMPNRLVFPHLSIVNEPADEAAKILDSQFIDMKVWDRNGIVEPPRKTRSIPSDRPWDSSARKLGEYIAAAWKDEDLPGTEGIRESFPRADLDRIAADMKADSDARPASVEDLKDAIQGGSFAETYIVECDGGDCDTRSALTDVWTRIGDLLPQDGVPEGGHDEPTGQPADNPSEERPMTREELLKNATVKELLAEAETRGKDSRDDEVAELTTKITTADEEKQTVQDALDAKNTELTEATDKLADLDKRTLVDKLIAIRVTLGDSDAKEKPDEVAEALMNRTTDSLRDAIADEEKRVPADDDDQDGDQDDQTTLDDPGQPITGGDGKPPEGDKPKTRLGAFLDDVRTHSG
jgi:hypothetical protein